LPAPPGVDRCAALLAYEDDGRELIARLKYRNARSTMRWLAVSMASLVDVRRVDVVTWIPTTAARRRDRGFDQAQLLAQRVARELRRPCHRLLVRATGAPQTGRSLVERRTGPSLTARPLRVAPRHVLVVDDVITTGTTIVVAARALHGSGVESVSVLAAARTPLKGARGESDTSEQ
jgi:ComF family protein